MSPSPRLEDSSGNESAEQQLFAESQASASKHRQLPTSAAIRSAHLLNAARADKLRPASLPPSSMPAHAVDTARKNNGSGKLKRPSFMREDMAKTARANLARRGDVYEFDAESPEKGHGAPYKLSEMVNHSKPIKRVKNPKKSASKSEPRIDVKTAPPVQEYTSSDDELFVPDGEAENEKSREGSERPITPKGNQRKSGRLAGKTVAIEHIDFSKQPGIGASKKTRSKRKTPGETTESDILSKSPRRESPPVHSKRSVSVVVRPKPQSSRKSAARSKVTVEDGALNNEEEALLPSDVDFIQQTGISGAQSQPDRQRRRREVHRKETLSSARPAEQLKNNRVTTRSLGRPRRKEMLPEGGALPTRSRRVYVEEAHAIAAQDGEAELSDLDRNVDVVESDDHRDTGFNLDPSNDEFEHVESFGTNQASAFRQVFEFTRNDSHRGKCKSDAAKDIQNACLTGKLLLRESETTLEDVSRSIELIRELLNDYGRGKNAAQRAELKADAYEYLFRNLVAFLVPLHGWFSQRHDEVREHVEAVRALHSLAEAIVSFIDSVASWEVPHSARQKNVTFGNDIGTQLIAPLRKIVDSYRIACEDLEQAERTRRALDEAVEKETQTRLRNERWRRWQDLHICRQECEPDIFRRRRLFIEPAIFASRYENPNERDANGVQFERIPLFRERDSPPRRTASDVREAWSDKQMEALIEGLTRFAGPAVFHNIFEKYCRPGGPLRNFGVPEITAQAASIRATLLSQYQVNNWEIPDWVKQIPILP